MTLGFPLVRLESSASKGGVPQVSHGILVHQNDLD